MPACEPARRLDSAQCHRALAARDARFDGRFFVGVKTTGIYCRPVCTAKVPQPKNCEFFPSAAAAEAECYRPCLRCRPELAPGHAAVDASHRIAQAAASLIEDGRVEEGGLPGLAESLGVSDRHLRRVFQQEFGVSPIEYAQTQRLLLAKRLLTDTVLPVTEIALASGFQSLRRFNDLFRTRYRLAPSQLRRQAAASDASAPLTFKLAYRPPYDWGSLAQFLARRALTGVEYVDERKYVRTVRIARGDKSFVGWIEVAPIAKQSALRVVASASLAGVVPLLIGQTKRLFDLACRPDEIERALGPLGEKYPGLRVPGAMDGFEVAVRAILGQQVNVEVARRIAGRLVAAFGERIETPSDRLQWLFPEPRTLARARTNDLGALGIIQARAGAIVALARAVESGDLRLDPSAPVEPTLAALERLPGVGPWTAHYIGMRALSWPDAFPHPDVAVLRAMGERKTARAPVAADRWRPFRAYAVLHLWRSLEDKDNGSLH
jgi:AraC family transcriptional regulator of adaptative response / DNA-3-methyladenine glycosylase II